MSKGWFCAWCEDRIGETGQARDWPQHGEHAFCTDGCLEAYLEEMERGKERRNERMVAQVGQDGKIRQVRM